jgi:hypothetical protein
MNKAPIMRLAFVTRMPLAMAALLASAASFAQSQSDLVQAQDVYNRAIAACNSGSLAAPRREACVRDAGAALDRVRGGPATPVEATSTDGRAIIMTPQVSSGPGTNSQPPASDIKTSNDGRATIVVPTDAVRSASPQ